MAIGVALDATYSSLQGWLSTGECQRVHAVLAQVGFELFDPALDSPELFAGLQEFREHLGGELAIQMLRGIGEGCDVHSIDEHLMRQSIDQLRKLAR